VGFLAKYRCPITFCRRLRIVVRAALALDASGRRDRASCRASCGALCRASTELGAKLGAEPLYAELCAELCAEP